MAATALRSVRERKTLAALFAQFALHAGTFTGPVQARDDFSLRFRQTRCFGDRIEDRWAIFLQLRESGVVDTIPHRFCFPLHCIQHIPSRTDTNRIRFAVEATINPQS